MNTEAVSEQLAATTEDGDPVEPAWKVDSITSADWALSRIRDLEKEIEEVERMKADAITRVELRAKRLSEDARRGIDFFRSKIHEYAEANRQSLITGKGKSRKLLHGVIGWRKTGGAPVKQDEKALLEWARTQPPESEFLRIKEEPNWSLIKKHITATGEDVPGTTIEPERDEFYVESK